LGASLNLVVMGGKRGDDEFSSEFVGGKPVVMGEGEIGEALIRGREIGQRTFGRTETSGLVDGAVPMGAQIPSYGFGPAGQQSMRSV